MITLAVLWELALILPLFFAALIIYIRDHRKRETVINTADILRSGRALPPPAYLAEGWEGGDIAPPAARVPSPGPDGPYDDDDDDDCLSNFFDEREEP